MDEGMPHGPLLAFSTGRAVRFGNPQKLLNPIGAAREPVESDRLLRSSFGALAPAQWNSKWQVMTLQRCCFNCAGRR